MVYGYARVSTKRQERNGNSLEAQREALTNAGAQKIFVDSVTGTKMDRPQFKALLENLNPGDTLIVTKLDRFARSCSQASATITDLIDKGITVTVLNMGTLSNDSVSTLLRNILLAFAQFERDMIVERTTEGKEIARNKAKEQGTRFVEGRPRLYKDDEIEMALNLLEKNSYKKVVGLTGISKSTLIRAKREKERKLNSGV
mgnify:CR=1 FL=1